MSITHKAIKGAGTTPNSGTLPVNCRQVSPQWGPLHKTFGPEL